LEDRRETHGICMAHRIVVQARWKDAARESGRGSAPLVSVGAANELSSSDVGRQGSLSVTHMWTGFKNFTWKSRP
jgi:hypothetical protein